MPTTPSPFPTARHASGLFLVLLAALLLLPPSFVRAEEEDDDNEVPSASRAPKPFTEKKQYKRAEWAFEQRAFPKKALPEKALVKGLEEVQAADAVQARRATPTNALQRARKGNFSLGTNAPSYAGVIAQWVNIGPSPIVGSQTLPNNVYDSTLRCSGRVSAIAIDPGDNNRWIIGGAQGGIWLTTDAGATWTPKTDNMPSLSTGALAFAPGNRNIVYAGTGESVDSDAYGGVGLLKSTDGGLTWTAVSDPSNTFLGVSFSEMRVSPSNSNTLLATTTQGLYGRSTDALGTTAPRGVLKSTDGGATWVKKLPTSGSAEASDLEVDASDFNNQFAAVSNGFGQRRQRRLSLHRCGRLLDGHRSAPGRTAPTSLAASAASRWRFRQLIPNVLYVSIQDRTDPRRTAPATRMTPCSSGSGRRSMRSTRAGLGANPDAHGNGATLVAHHQLLVDPNDSRVLYFGESRLQI